MARQQNVSDQTAQLIAVEVRKLIDAALAESRRILTAHRRELETLAQGLLRFETLSGADIRGLLAADAPAREHIGFASTAGEHGP